MAGRPKKSNKNSLSEKLTEFETKHPKNDLETENVSAKKEDFASSQAMVAQEFKIDGIHFKRHLDFHSQNSHASHGHPPIFSLNDTMFNLPKSVMQRDPDYVYAFTAIDGMGNNKVPYEGLHSAVANHWWPVSRSEDPELARRYFTIAGRDHDQNLIRVKDQVAVKRLKTIHKEQMDLYDNINRADEEFRKNMTLFNDSFVSTSPSLAPKERHTVIV